MSPIRTLLFTVALIGVCVAGNALIMRWRMRPPSCPNCNVMIISLDQVRARSLPCFGYRENTAPNLCGFAARSYTFTNAYATASRTMDSHFSMITSRYPSGHRMNLPYASRLPDSVPTLAQLLKEEGYRTYYLGVVSDPHLPIREGLGRGFDRIIDADDPNMWPDALETIGKEATDSSKPALYFFHTYDAHEPYMPDKDALRRFNIGPDRTLMTYEELCRFTYRKLRQLRPQIITSEPQDIHVYCERLDQYMVQHINNSEEFNDVYTIFNDEYWKQFEDLPIGERNRYTHALYVAQMYMLDKKLGTLFGYLKRSGMLDTTMVIIVGDQGDEFYEHGSYSHGWSLYDEVLRVPFIVYVPRRTPVTSGKLVSLVDIVPTVFDVLGKRLTIPVDGLSVFASKTHEAVVSEHMSDGAFALRTDTFTIIRRIVNDAFQIELYNRREDPNEQQNIFRGNADQVKRLLQTYNELVHTVPAHDAGLRPLPTWLNDDDRQRLIESGYF